MFTHIITHVCYKPSPHGNGFHVCVAVVVACFIIITEPSPVGNSLGMPRQSGVHTLLLCSCIPLYRSILIKVFGGVTYILDYIGQKDGVGGYWFAKTYILEYIYY